MRIERLGESAIALTAEPPATLDAQRRFWALAEIVRLWKGVAEAVLGTNNLTLFADPGMDAAELEARLRSAYQSTHARSAPDAKLVEIPVSYGGANSPDLHDVAQRCGLSETDVVTLHTAIEYVVYFVGFQPGFAYLGDLDARLHLPRRSEPRTAVPAGSVGIAENMTGVYPSRSPGGWHVVGRTNVELFNVQCVPASLMKPGDRVRFVPA